MNKRVINPETHLKGLINDGTEFYIGFGAKTLTESGRNHPDIKALLEGIKDAIVLSGKSGPLKDNVKGKYVRAKPNKKTSVWRHIEYFSHKYGKQISYDRLFEIWEKVLLHKYNLQLRIARTPQREIVFYFPEFIMKDDKELYLQVGAAMNMAYSLSNYYAMYDANFNPIIPITKYQDKSLLPAGILNKPLDIKVAEIEKRLESQANVESTGNSYRFAVLKEQAFTDITIGKGGFDEYLRFEYAKHDLLIFENLRTGNATYIFKLSSFDEERNLDKQNAMKDPAFIKRVIHENMDSWSKQIGYLFK